MNLLVSDFDPFRRSQDTRYDVKETPAATNVNVPDTPTVRNVAKPTTGMGVPISFGVNLPDVTAEDPFMVGKFVEVPMDQGKRPTVVSGVGGSNMIVENKPKTVDIATSQQESFRIDSSNTNQVSTVDVQAPAVGPVPNIQQRVRQEPDLPFSRQPIIETQPAVDFMSSFLSQPIDPTRRGNGQKTVDTQTDISIVPLESQQTVSEPAQTLAQDAKSRDWRSFISTFLMGGGPGLEQMGHASFGPMDNTGLSGIGGQSQSSFTGSNTNLDASSQGQMSSSSTSQADIGSQGQMNVLASGSTDRQMDVSGMGSMDRQMDVSGMSSMDSQMGVSGTLSTESQMGVTGMRPMDRQMDVSGMRSMDSQMGVSGTRSIDSQMDVSGMRSMDNQMNMAGTRSIDSQMDVSGTRSMDNQMNMAGTRSMDRQMGVSGTPSMGSQMDASGTPSMGSSQMDVSRPVSMDRQAVGDLSRSQNQISDISTGLSSNLVQDKMYGSKPQLTDTITDQTSGQYAGQMENQLLSSIDTYKRASLDQSNGLSQGQIQEPRIVTADQSAPKEVKMADSTLIDSNPLVIDLTSSGIPADNVIPTGGVQASGINVGLDVGANTQYDIAQNTQGQMENVVGLSETRPMDMPQAAEVTGVSTKVSPFDASSSDSASALDLGLSDKPLTSFEGASPSDLQKLKLLEVAQRLLLQERGIQDPQAGSQTQTFTPLGMTGGLDSILSSLNQGNNMGEMIRSSLNQGSSQTLGMTSAQFADIASTKTSKENTPITKLADTTPKKNFQLGEWSSGVPVGTGGQDSVPIGNIFAGRFLQSGTELPLVGGTAVSPTAGIPIGQSLASKVLSTLSASTSGESATTGSRGGGLIIKDKLPISFQRPCNAVRDPASKYHFYRTVGAGRIRFRCALGTAFDDGTCECSIRVVSSGKVPFSFYMYSVTFPSDNSTQVVEYLVIISVAILVTVLQGNSDELYAIGILFAIVICTKNKSVLRTLFILSHEQK